MLELTGAMRTEFVRLAESLTAAHAAIRLTRDRGGKLHLVPDTPEEGDVVLIRWDNLPPLIGSPRVAADAQDGILHFHALADERYDGASVVLLRPREGSPRPDWRPPERRKPATARDFRAVFRRRAAPAPTTQSASL
jgi:hypothetical protein